MEMFTVGEGVAQGRRHTQHVPDSGPHLCILKTSDVYNVLVKSLWTQIPTRE